VALLRGFKPRPVSETRPISRSLIADGRIFLARHNVRDVPDDVALEVGYCLAMVGPSLDLVAQACDRLGIAYEIVTDTRGRRRFAWDAGATREPEAATAAQPRERPRTGERNRGRTAVVNVRLNPRDKAALEKLADESKATVSTWVREKLLEVVEAERTSPESSPEAEGAWRDWGGAAAPRLAALALRQREEA